MLHFFPPGMLERYALFTFLAVLGVLQLIAARHEWAGLSLPGRPRWRWGYGLGAILLGGAYLWFFGTAQALIFQPGLAGAELFTVFAGSTLAAIAATLAVASILHGQAQQPTGVPGERVELQPGWGTLRKATFSNPWPAVIIISDLPGSDFPTSRLAEQVVSRGALVLHIDLGGGGPLEYPEILARLPAACAYLQERPDVRGHGITLIGVGLGGDLALRAAATDMAVRGVAAVDPVLHPDAVGFESLQHTTFAEAWRWDGLRRRLAEQVGALDRLPGLAGRPAQIVLRTNSQPWGSLTTGSVQVTAATSSLAAIGQIAQWVEVTLRGNEHVA